MTPKAEFTEADEVVGRIELDGTIGLYLFGGILPGLLSGAIYVLIRRFLPAGRFGGVVFGLLHLVIAATRIDPLRPDNPDFDLVGPGWLSVTTFGLTCVLHGMAVVAIANRYSTSLPPAANSRAAWIRVLVPLAMPAVFVVIPFVAAALILGLALTIVFSRFVPAVRAAHSRGALLTAAPPVRRGPRPAARHDHRPTRRDRSGHRRRRFDSGRAIATRPVISRVVGATALQRQQRAQHR